jgi:hypothetical protein
MIIIPRARFFVAIVLMTVALSGCASAGRKSSVAPSTAPAAAARLAAIRHAQVWAATNVAAMDIMTGPTGPGSFAPNATVTCDYREKATSGNSPKFTCVIPPDDEVKVKFGPDNGEVFAEVAASRLLWALGFGADRMYPVQVICRGCPANITGTDVASIQRKMPGKDIEAGDLVGWSWPELDLLDADAAPEQRAERDALKLLAALLQHTDSKPEQQRLLCIGGSSSPAGSAPCARTFMMVHDLGLTFGTANRFNRNSIGSANLKTWADSPVWKDKTHCVANLKKSRTGTLDNPVISEQGRQFLAALLVQLTDAQLHDLFAVARVTRRSASPDGPPIAPSIDAWVTVFKVKRAQIVDHACRTR